MVRGKEEEEEDAGWPRQLRPCRQNGATRSVLTVVAAAVVGVMVVGQTMKNNTSQCSVLEQRRLRVVPLAAETLSAAVAFCTSGDGFAA